jgi:hypothetical protein
VKSEELAVAYFELWMTTDEVRRHHLIGEVFAESAVHYAAPANVAFRGIDAIASNIRRVNSENIQKAGLSFTAGQALFNHDTVQLEWSVETPAGKTVATGRDFLLVNDQGQVHALYMFNGV